MIICKSIVLLWFVASCLHVTLAARSIAGSQDGESSPTDDRTTFISGELVPHSDNETILLPPAPTLSTSWIEPSLVKVLVTNAGGSPTCNVDSVTVLYGMAGQLTKNVTESISTAMQPGLVIPLGQEGYYALYVYGKCGFERTEMSQGIMLHYRPGVQTSVKCPFARSSGTSSRKSSCCLASGECKFDMKRWMTDLYDAGFKDHKLKDIFIPGTHDSMTYDLSLGANLGGGQSCNEGAGVFQDIGLITQLLGADQVTNFVRASAIANTRTLTQQLDMGIRMFDFRPYAAGPDTWYFSHCKVTNEQVPHYLSEMKDWLDKSKENGQKEIIIIDWRREDFIKAGGGMTWNSAVDIEGFRLVEKYLGAYMVTDVSVQNFASTLDEIAKNGPVVFVIADTPNTDPWQDASQPEDKSLVKRIMKRSDYLEQPYGEEDTVLGVKKRIGGHLDAWKGYTGDKLFSILGVITCSGETFKSNKGFITSEFAANSGPNTEGKRSFILSYIDTQTPYGLPHEDNIAIADWMGQQNIPVATRGMAFMYDNPHQEDIEYIVGLNVNMKRKPGLFSYPRCPVCTKSGFSNVYVTDNGGCVGEWKVVTWRLDIPFFSNAYCQCEYIGGQDAGCGSGRYNGNYHT